MDHECLRCGTLLPEDEEGICPTCGVAYGGATLLAMPAVDANMIERHQQQPEPVPVHVGAGNQSKVETQPSVQEEAPPSRALIMLFIALLLMIVGGVAALIILVLIPMMS